MKYVHSINHLLKSLTAWFWSDNMKKKFLVVITIIVIVLSVICYKEFKSYPGTVLVDVVIDVSNMQEVVDSVDLIFVGTVSDAKTLLLKEDDKSEIEVTVNECIKGDLQAPSEIIVYKYGGHFLFGNEVEYIVSEESYTPIPEVGKQYIFLGFKQEDGKVILAEYYGNIEYTGEEQVSEISQYVQTK